MLQLVMQGLPDKAIARRLQRSIGTAKTHVKAILTKLEVPSRAEAIAVARRRGLVRDDLWQEWGLRHASLAFDSSADGAGAKPPGRYNIERIPVFDLE